MMTGSPKWECHRFVKMRIPWDLQDWTRVLGTEAWASCHFYYGPQMSLRYHRSSRLGDPSASGRWRPFISSSFCWFSLWFSGLPKYVKALQSLSRRVYKCPRKMNAAISKLSRVMMVLWSLKMMVMIKKKNAVVSKLLLKQRRLNSKQMNSYVDFCFTKYTIKKYIFN